MTPAWPRRKPDGFAEAAGRGEDVLEGEAHGGFVDAWADEMGIEAEEFWSGALCGADGAVGFAAEGEDGVEVGECFDVADDGGFAEEALDGGEGRADADFRALAFD